MPIEYEHRYLVEKIPKIDDNAKHITQFYIAYDSERIYVQRGRMTCSHNDPPKYQIAHKIDTGINRREIEYEVSPEHFHELKTFFRIGSIINKVRHHVEINGLLWDVDIYENGMITAELEDPPDNYSLDGFGKTCNIIDMVEFSNYKISEQGYPEYKQLL